MQLKIYGTRGSLPIFNEKSLKYGGNTTCVRFFNKNLPHNSALCIDAGSGFLSMGNDILEQEPEINKIITLFTHWHHDHTIGLFHSPVLFIQKYFMHLIGPLDNGVGPQQMMENMMTPPYFPIDIREVRGHFKYNDLKYAGHEIVLLHKKGVKLISAEKLLKIENSTDEKLIKIKKTHHPLSEFLVIKTYKSLHGGLTLSYRIEDRSTGKVFVMLTDHENQDGIPPKLIEHLQDADLLIMDCQYTREKYEKMCAGYGHSTPDFVIRLATLANVKKVGLTHHDPMSTDDMIDAILEEAKSYIPKDSNLKVFACSDYMDVQF